MNHLAHLLIARRTGTSPSGALLADALRHLGDGERPPAFLEGVRLHRAVDDFTDAHPAVARSRARLGAGPRHYRGVLVDVWYDHCLARRWSRFSSIPLRDFASTTYDALQDELDRPGWPRAPWVRRMIEADWLTAFLGPAGAVAAIRRMRGRVRRPDLLELGVSALGPARSGLQSDFDVFFPDLLRHVDARLADSTAAAETAEAGAAAGR